MSFFKKRQVSYLRQYETNRLYLRVIGPEWADVTLDYHLRNRDFLAEWDPNREAYFFTKSGQTNQLKYEVNDFKDRSLIRFWIFKKEDESRAIGNLCFSNIVYGNFKSCFLGYKLDKDEINKGYMTEAVKRGIEIMFDEYNLHRVEVNIIPRNIRSLKVAEKLNLEREGFSRRYLMINNVWEDHIHFAAYNDNADVMWE
jgi:ribosomal-protein-alanine N-acetyltransferase